jgi:hypothetical protein
MKIIIALVIMHCQNYFSPEVCMEDTLKCVETYMDHKPVYDYEPIVVSPEDFKLANAYKMCTQIVTDEF